MTLEKLCARLRDFGVQVEAGDDSELIACGIQIARLEYVICGRGANKKPLTFKQAFEEVFGVALEAQQ